MLASARSALLALLLLLLAIASAAHADNSSQCNAAYEKADLLVHSASSDKLIEAREELRACAHPSCKAWMTKDCAKWLSDVEQRIPTVVLVARETDGTELSDVTVFVDDKPIAERLDGRAIEMNPGARVFVFKVADGRRVEQRALVKEGERSQVVAVSFSKSPGLGTEPTRTQPAPLAAAAAPGSETPRATPWRTVGWVTGGGGVVGLAIGAAFGIAAINQNNASNANGCVNNQCPPDGLSARHSAQDDATASTVAFVAGGVLAAAGVVLVLVAPTSGPSRGRLELGPLVGQNSAGAMLGGSW